MRHFALIVSSLSLTLCLFNKRSICLKVSRRPRPKPTRVYNTRENIKKQMDKIKQEVHELREEVTTLRGELEKLNILVASLVASQD